MTPQLNPATFCANVAALCAAIDAEFKARIADVDECFDSGRSDEVVLTIPPSEGPMQRRYLCDQQPVSDRIYRHRPIVDYH